MPTIWEWKKKAVKFFGKGNVKVFIKDGKQVAAVRISNQLPFDYFELDTTPTTL